MLGYKEISSYRNKKCKLLYVEKQNTRYILLVYPELARTKMAYNTLREIRLKGMRVPKVIQMADQEILLEYVDGRTLYEELTVGPVFKVGMLSNAFGKLLKQFCDLRPGERIGNVDVRAIIVHGTQLFCLDGDCLLKGTLEEELADAILSVLSEKEIEEVRKVGFIKGMLASSEADLAAVKEAVIPLAAVLRQSGHLSLTDEQILAYIH